MSTAAVHLSNVQALATSLVDASDPGLNDEFAQKFGMSPQDFLALENGQQQNHLSQAQERVFECGSDKSAWYAKVVRRSGAFEVQVFDADGDRRPEREGVRSSREDAIKMAKDAVLTWEQREALSKVFERGAFSLSESDIEDAICGYDLNTYKGWRYAAQSLLARAPDWVAIKDGDFGFVVKYDGGIYALAEEDVGLSAEDNLVDFDRSAWDQELGGFEGDKDASKSSLKKPVFIDLYSQVYKCNESEPVVYESSNSSSSKAMGDVALSIKELDGIIFDWAVAEATGRTVTGVFLERNANGLGLHEYFIKTAGIFSPSRTKSRVDRLEAQFGMSLQELLKTKFGDSLEIPSWVMELHLEQIDINSGKYTDPRTIAPALARFERATRNPSVERQGGRYKVIYEVVDELGDESGGNVIDASPSLGM